MVPATIAPASEAAGEFAARPAIVIRPTQGRPSRSGTLYRVTGEAHGDGAEPGSGVRFLASHVIAEHQLLRMRRQIYLPGQIGDVVHADVMADQGDRHHEGHELAPVVL